MGGDVVAADLRFYDLDDNELDTSSPEGGLQFGTVRNKKGSVLPIKIKNTGDKEAIDCQLFASTLHHPTQVSPEEYEKELVAKKWKSFSLYVNSNYTSMLELGNVPPNSFVRGVEEEHHTLKEEPETWETAGHAVGVYQYGTEGLEIIGGDEGNTKAFKGRLLKKEFHKEVDLTHEFIMASSIGWSGSTHGSCVCHVLRRNSKKDNRGYNVIFYCNEEKKQMYVEVRKDAMGIDEKGITTSTKWGIHAGTRATRAQTSPIPYLKGQLISLRIKLSTNQQGLPQFEIWINKEKQIFSILNNATTTTKRDYYIDTQNKYPSEGEVYIGYCGYYGGSFFGKKLDISADSKEGKIYIKTLPDAYAINQNKYLTSIKIAYDEND